MAETKRTNDADKQAVPGWAEGVGHAVPSEIGMVALVIGGAALVAGLPGYLMYRYFKHQARRKQGKAPRA